jgi:hypothetical protein
MTLQHATDQELADFDGRRLSPSDLVRVTDHLASCRECQARLGEPDPASRMASLRAAFLGAPVTELAEHVEGDELAAYVDGTLDRIDAETVASHLEDCPACMAEVRDLQAFRTGWTESPAKGSRPTSRRRTIMAGIGLAAAAALVWVFLPRLSSKNAPGHGEDATVRVALNDDSGPVTIDAHGHWSGWPDQASATDARIRRVLESRKLDVPADVARLAGLRAQLRGGGPNAPASFLVSPIGVVVEQDRPVFRWRAVADARAYVVIVATDAGAVLVNSPPVTATEWTPSEPLARGQSYVWQVTASTARGAITAPRPPEPEARFRVLSDEAFRAIEAAGRAAPPPHHLLGVLEPEARLLYYSHPEHSHHQRHKKR